MTDVCFEVGFQSLGSFSTLFRRCVGDAPNNYRERQKQSLRKVPGCFILMYGLGNRARGSLSVKLPRSVHAPLAIFEKPVSVKPLMLLRKSDGGNRES